jgi:hypothetical protein
MNVTIALLTGVLISVGGASTATPARRGPLKFEVVRMSYSYKAKFTGYESTLSTPEGRRPLFRNGAGETGESTLSCTHPKGRARRLCPSLVPPGRFPLTRSHAPCDFLYGTGCIPLRWGNLPLSGADAEHYEELESDGSWAPKKCGARVTEQRRFGFDIRLEGKTVRVGFSLPIPDQSCGIAAWRLRRRPKVHLQIPLRKFRVRPGKTIRISDRFKTTLVPPADTPRGPEVHVSGTYRSTRLLELKRVDGLRRSRR